MKKRIIIFISVFVIVLGSVLAIYTMIGADVKVNIAMAEQKYQTNPEDALISFLLDENNTATDRTHKAIWTLGQIKSEKALSILQQLYNNDPKGETCYGRHQVVLCQYELYKAIKAVEENRLFSYARYK